jgi:hypothetical protein
MKEAFNLVKNFEFLEMLNKLKLSNLLKLSLKFPF